MKKRLFSLLLVLCMAMSLIPSSVIAEEIEASVCTCQSACTAESRDGGCPVCGAESATEADCALYAAPEAESESDLSAAERVQALIDALPAAAEVAGMTEAERDEVYADAEEAYAAFESLESAEDMAAITGLEKLSALMEALTAPAETYDDESNDPAVLLLGGIDVIANPTGDGYSYSNGVLTLTNYDNKDVLTPSRAIDWYYFYTALYCSDDLTLKLVGTNKLTMSDADMTKNKTGSGVSEQAPLYSAIYVSGSLTIESGESTKGKLIAKAGYGALQAGGVFVRNVDLELTAYRDCLVCNGLDIQNNSNVKAVSSGDDLNYRAVSITSVLAGGAALNVDNSTLTAETHGYSCNITYTAWDGTTTTTYEHPHGIRADGLIQVQNNGVVIGKSLNSSSGKSNADCEGFGIYCQGAIIDTGGRLEGYALGKRGDSANGADGIFVDGKLELRGKGTVYGETNCSTRLDGSEFCYKYGAIRVGSIPWTATANGIEGSRCYITTPSLGRVIETDGAKYIGDVTYPRAKQVKITGIHDCTLTLTENLGNLTYGYYDTKTYSDGQSFTPGVNYTGTLDLTQTNTLGTGDNMLVMTRPTDAILIRGIVVEKGQHKLKIPDGIYPDIHDVFIRVKSGATLDLYLAGGTTFLDKRTEFASGAGPIVVEPGGTLNIHNGSDKDFASLSIYTSASADETSYAAGIDNGPGVSILGSTELGNVSVDHCILKVRGRERTLAATTWRPDIMTNLTIGSGAYVDANVGTIAKTPSLKMNGGTLVGEVYTTDEAIIQYSGIGNLQLTNADKIKVVDAADTNTQLWPVEVTLHDAYGLFDEQTYTANIPTYSEGNRRMENWRMRVVSSLTIARSASLSPVAQDEAGEIPLHLTGAASEKQNCKLTLYLKAGDLVTKAKIKAPETSETVSYWTSAAKSQQIIAAANTTATGALYTVGHLLMNGVMSLRGAEPADSSKGIVLQVCPDWGAANNAYWIDYKDTNLGLGYNTFCLKTPEGYGVVAGYTLRAESNEHKIILDGLRLNPSSDISCVELVGVDRSSTSTKVLPPHLIIAMLDGTSRGDNVFTNTTNPIFNMQSSTSAKAGNTLEFVGVRDLGSSYQTGAGGKLTLKGGQAFGNTDNSDLIFDSAFLDNQCTFENDPNNSHTFRNLTFKNSTVIGLGNVTVTGSLTIDGGSVDLSTDSTVKNSKGNAVYKKTFAFPSGCAGKEVSILQINGLGDNSYESGNIFTDGSGRITLWLPGGASVEYAYIDGVKYYPMELGNGSYEFSTGTPASIVAPTTAQTCLVLKSDASTTLSVTASGAPSPSYLWERSKDGGTSWAPADNSLFQITDMSGGGSSPNNREKSFSAVPSSVNGTELYRCKVSNSYTGEDNQEKVTTVYSPLFTMYLLPAVDTTKLLDQTVRTGETATFSVNMTAATPEGLTARYQWQRLVGETWTDIENATGTTYAPAATAAMDGWQLRYQVTYTAADGTSRTQSSTDLDGRAMKLVVVDVPVIGTQPVSDTIAVNTDTTFTVVATGNQTLGYQWQRLEGASWSDIENATGSSYTVSNAAEALDGAQYRCVVTNSANGVDNAVNSDAVTLTVVGIPVVTDQPDADTVRAGESVTFTLAATGNHTLSYQWQVKSGSTGWANISGATATTYTVATTVEMDGWQYRCVVTNTSGSVSRTADSDAANLTVVSAPVIGTHPVSETIAVNGEATFTAAATGNKTIRYQWQQSRDGGASWSDIENATGSSYTVSDAAEARDGTQYRCAAINSVNGVDNVRPSDAATLTVVGHPVITRQPGKVSVTVHSDAVFTIGVLGNHTLSYQWQRSEDDGASWSDITGATAAAYTESDVAFAMKDWQYRCIVTNTSGSVSLRVTSEAALLDPVMPPAVKKEDLTVPVSSDAGSVEVKASVSGGNATVEVSDEQIEKVAQDGSGAVTVDVSGLKNAESATLPAHVVEKTDEAAGTALTVALPDGSVSLDEKALASVSEGKDVTVSVRRVSATDLNDAQRKAVGGMANIGIVVDVDLYVGSAKRSSFGGGKLTISVPYTPKKGEDVSKLTVWFIRDDGTIENMGGYYDAAKKCFIFETSHLSRCLLVNTGEMQGFVDVPVEKYFYSAVNWAASNGITGGTDATHFSPYASCTRGQLVTFLWRAAGEPTAKNAAGFTDVAAGRYCEDAVAWAAENEIVGGYDDGTFRPDATVTRQQTAAILWRFAKYAGMDVSVGEDTNILSYNDALTISDYAFPAIQWAVGTAVMGGSGDKLLPRDTCTRAQIVTMLYRCIAE